MRFSSLQPLTSNLHVLITGASSGIGAALALEYAAPGVRLSLRGRSVERLAQVAAETEKRGAAVAVEVGDVTDAAAMTAWIEAADALQPLDLVIANAGISGGTSGLEDSRRQVETILAVNLNGVLNTIHPALPLMLKRRHGQIAIMSSLAGLRGFPGSGAYCASKAAVRAYGEALCADLADSGVKINVICPGWIKTPMTDVNTFRMPFLMDADRAARLIRKGLERNRSRIAFPWPMYAMIQLAALLPQDWLVRMLRKMPKKPPFDAKGDRRL